MALGLDIEYQNICTLLLLLYIYIYRTGNTYHLWPWLRCLILLARRELSAVLQFFTLYPSTRYQISYGRIFVEEHQHSLSAPCGWSSCFNEGCFCFHSIMFQASCFIMKMYLFSRIIPLHFLPLYFTPVSIVCLSHYCPPLLRKCSGYFLTPLCQCIFVHQCETAVVCTDIWGQVLGAK